MNLDHYVVLGVDPSSDFQGLKKAYYRCAMACHPDRFGGSREKGEQFKRVVEAFNVLSDPLGRARYDASRADRGEPVPAEPAGAAWQAAEDEGSILDTFADDILEEMIVGNTIPEDTTLQTLMLDLENTERFCMFREAKNLFYAGRIDGATRLFIGYLGFAPENLLAHHFLARCCSLHGQYRKAARQLGKAIRIGERRRPPLRLNRIRGELDALRRNRLGWSARVRAALAGDGWAGEEMSPAEEMRRAVQRSMNRMLREENARRRGLPGAER